MMRAWTVLPFSVLLIGCGVWGFSYGSRKDLRTPLEKAAQNGDLTIVKQLLASGSDPNGRSGSFGSPLNAAVMRKDNVEIIRTLVAGGTNPDGRAPDGNRCWVSPLFDAASMGDMENAQALLAAGASTKQPQCSSLVAGWFKAPILELLVAHGLDLNAVDEKGRNELHIALAPPVVPPVEGIAYLIRAGVPLNARDRSGKTPLAYWREPRDYEIHWFTTWLLDRLSGDSPLQHEREDRSKISALLAQSHAAL